MENNIIKKLMKSEEKAKELIEFFKSLVYCYMGSGMLSNDYDEKIVLKNTKTCAIRCVEEVLSSIPTYPSEVYLEDWNDDYKQVNLEEEIQARTYWENVLEYIHLL